MCFAAPSRRIVIDDQLIVAGTLLEVFRVHFPKHDRVPRFVTLIGRYVVLSGPSPQANFLNEVNLRQSRVQDCSPFVRYNQVGKETAVKTRVGQSTATNHRLRIAIVLTTTQEKSPGNPVA